MGGVRTVGLDIGSTATKCVVLEDGRDMAAKAVIPVGAGTTGPDRAFAAALAACGAAAADLGRVCATGYGRNSYPGADMEKSEMSCHARGAARLIPGVRTLIDIGGQDVKVLRLSPEGGLLDFVMNDKCAAGTGRFLDVMARVLEVDVAELAELDARSTRRVDISSTCTVFAESEVISRLAAKDDVRDIAAGIHRSVSSRAAGLARRLGVEPQVGMTGGVACNAGVVRALGAHLGVPVATSPLGQFAGALGAAIYAYEEQQIRH